MPLAPDEYAHKEWLGYVQPTGLVVSVPALRQAQAQVDRNVVPAHRTFLDALVLDPNGDEPARLRDFREFARDVLEWRESDLVGGPLRDELEVVLETYNETLRPTWAVRDIEPANPAKPWILLIQELAAGTDFDDAVDQDHHRHWPAPPQAKFERLLRETQVPAGLLVNGTQLRLVYAPRGETSGYLTFDVGQMAQVAGRPIFAALLMLLGEQRLFSLPASQRLPALLAESRKYQNTVSTKLAGQVTAALFELLRGFQAANEQSGGVLLRDVLEEDPNHVYNGLLTVLMRLVFLLYAEDRNLLSNDPVYVNHYGVTGLFDRLREDAGRYPDTMMHRYGAWAQLLTLFRLIHDGGAHGDFRLAERRGDLFDPDRYNFLEGRPWNAARRHADGDASIPQVPDGVIYGVLEKLLILDGERLSYRTLDVEQIGSVYEAVMGFRLEIATGRSIAIKPAKSHGAPATINLEELLATKPATRNEWLKLRTDKKLTGRTADAVKSAATIEDLLVALDRQIDRAVTPHVVPAGSMVFQPSDERRRSGAHYTPRSLTEPIVRKTLEPVLARLRGESGVGSGESGTPQGGRDERRGELVSGPEGLEGRDVTRQGVLPADEDLPAGRTVRDDEPDSPGGSVDPGEHRRGERPREYGRVRSVPQDRSGQPEGAGDASDPLSRRRTLHAAPGGTAADPDRRTRSHAPSTDPQPANTTRQPEVATSSPTPDSRFPTPQQILNLKVCDPAMGSGAFLVAAGRQLAEELVKAWHAHGQVPRIPPDEDELLHARRLVAQRCLYGVDKNPMAVVLAKLSLWLDTLAKDHPFTFLDHTLRAGDSLVGLTRRQILNFSWETTRQQGLDETYFKERLDAALAARREILDAGDEVPYLLRQQKLAVADERLALPRLVGDLAVSAFFAGKKKSQRKQRRDELREQLEDWLTSGMRPELREPLAEAVTGLRGGEHPVEPFHWEIEFPEVFGRENGGFDGFVGNPPFSGVVQAALALGERYTEYLRSMFPPAGGKTDLVAFFFRRVFEVTGDRGAFGLIATNTIGQGDTRESGLAFICNNGGVVFSASKRMRWPGTANVIVSVVWVAKSLDVTPKRINGRPVEYITAFLFHSGGNHEPAKLQGCPAVSSKGVVPYGMGFTFEDGRDDASPLSEADQLLATNPRNSQVIKRFLGGEDLNSEPTCCPDRFIIDFGDMAEKEAAAWPEVLDVVKRKVLPMRLALTTQSGAAMLKEYWWRYAFTAKALSAASKRISRVLVTSQTSKYRVFCFLPSGWVFDQKVVVFANETWGFFTVMSSRAHEAWSSFFSSTMKDDPVYTPSDCFETFPFPPDFESNPALEAAGKAYYEFRAGLMVRNDEGLTKTYNRFHDRDHDTTETAPEIVVGIRKLRELHAAMDRAVLDAYGWTDIDTRCEFLLDYEDDDDEEQGGRTRRRKKPWRYRWPDDVRDEVLARLLALNAERAEQERLTGMPSGKSTGGKPKKTGTTKRGRKAKGDEGGLF